MDCPFFRAAADPTEAIVHLFFALKQERRFEMTIAATSGRDNEKQRPNFDKLGRSCKYNVP